MKEKDKRRRKKSETSNDLYRNKKPTVAHYTHLRTEGENRKVQR